MNFYRRPVRILIKQVTSGNESHSDLLHDMNLCYGCCCCCMYPTLTEKVYNFDENWCFRVVQRHQSIGSWSLESVVAIFILRSAYDWTLERPPSVPPISSPLLVLPSSNSQTTNRIFWLDRKRQITKKTFALSCGTSLFFLNCYLNIPDRCDEWWLTSLSWYQQQKSTIFYIYSSHLLPFSTFSFFLPFFFTFF